jgi:hypothetical protein
MEPDQIRSEQDSLMDAFNSTMPMSRTAEAAKVRALWEIALQLSQLRKITGEYAEHFFLEEHREHLGQQ